MRKVFFRLFVLTTFSVFFISNLHAQSFKNKLGMTFVKIPPGTFYMGSPQNEPGRERDEKRHLVKLTRGFYMATTEVTQTQWFKIMGYNPSAFNQCGGNCPVERVSWDQSQEFLTKLNKLERTTKYRLPTEAEWEYACRAGTQTALYSGDISSVDCSVESNLDRVAWYCGNSGVRNPVSVLKSHPVGLKEPNGWGLYDMHGNVQEWVQDSCKWRDRLKGKVGVITDTYVDGIVDPLSTIGDRKIFRGGSWNMSIRYARSANRSYYRASAYRNNLGFRVVKDQ